MRHKYEPTTRKRLKSSTENSCSAEEKVKLSVTGGGRGVTGHTSVVDLISLFLQDDGGRTRERPRKVMRGLTVDSSHLGEASSQISNIYCM